MADFIDQQYAMMLSNRLVRFQVKNQQPLKINFRCPLCGDSSKSMKKARGWLTEVKTDHRLHYSCFNCGSSLSFPKFLKTVDPLLAKDYVVDKYLKDKVQRKQETETVLQDAKPNFGDPLKKIKKLSSLAYDHPVKRYIEQRQIPSHQHYRIYYAPKFNQWINSIIPDKLQNMKEEPRLVLPFMDEKGNCYGVSGRSFDPHSSLRYITIMFEDRPKIFGMDKIDQTKPFKIVEGPIDSFFLSNAVAMAGADGNAHDLNVKNATFVFDNEPRNKEVLKQMQGVIDKGNKICIWPSYIKQKDLNDMWLAGNKDLDKLIDENTFVGLMAKAEFASWRKR